MLVLQKVVDILKSVTDKAIRIEGHTDNVKIGEVLARKYPTNWELSASRAVNVTRFLQAQGLNPEDLSAAAYGEYMPVADNETSEGRVKNRRIEIVLIAKNR
jgi:chemotaxis protein MotB